ncbi:hypothetical protein EDB19DRAFT_2038245 [Suillus lakei]|nr:hypothetical protein EDB19DRAFT_2038245 [Suillus lakei]
MRNKGGQSTYVPAASAGPSGAAAKYASGYVPARSPSPKAPAYACWSFGRGCFFDIIAPIQVTAAVVTRVRALHTFEPTEPGELAFENGEVIKVVDRGYKDWWREQLKGRTGIFPVNYVEPLPEPTAAELAREAEQEAAVFAQAANREPSRKRGDSGVISLMLALRPKIVKLIDKYNQKRADLVSMNESFVKARTIFDRIMDDNLCTKPVRTRHNPTDTVMTNPSHMGVGVHMQGQRVAAVRGEAGVGADARPEADRHYWSLHKGKFTVAMSAGHRTLSPRKYHTHRLRKRLILSSNLGSNFDRNFNNNFIPNSNSHRHNSLLSIRLEYMPNNNSHSCSCGRKLSNNNLKALARPTFSIQIQRTQIRTFRHAQAQQLPAHEEAMHQSPISQHAMYMNPNPQQSQYPSQPYHQDPASAPQLSPTSATSGISPLQRTSSATAGVPAPYSYHSPTHQPQLSPTGQGGYAGPGSEGHGYAPPASNSYGLPAADGYPQSSPSGPGYGSSPSGEYPQSPGARGSVHALQNQFLDMSIGGPQVATS